MNKRKVTSWPPKSKLCICIFSPHQVNDVGSVGIGANEEESKPCKNASHVGEVTREGNWIAFDIVVCVIVVHDGIDVLQNQVAECAFGASVGPRIVVNSKDQ